MKAADFDRLIGEVRVFDFAPGRKASDLFALQPTQHIQIVRAACLLAHLGRWFLGFALS